MISAILSLLGLGGIGAALFFLPGLRAAVAGICRAIPPKVWLALACIALLAGAVWYHGRAVDRARAEGREAANLQWQGAFDTAHRAALQWRAAYQDTSTRLATIRKEAHETERRRIAADADTLRLRGPGRAAAPVCGRIDPAGLSPAPGGPERPDRPGNAPLAPLPDGEPMAIVPWRDLTRWGEQADQWRSEALTWRTWYYEQRAAHDAARARLDEVQPFSER